MCRHWFCTAVRFLQLGSSLAIPVAGVFAEEVSRSGGGSRKTEPPRPVVRPGGVVSHFRMPVFAGQSALAGFMARSVAQHFERQGLLTVLPLRIALPLPPVGIITLRGKRWTPTSEQMIECLRKAARP